MILLPCESDNLGKHYLFKCPACQVAHYIRVTDDGLDVPFSAWNGNPDSPTLEGVQVFNDTCQSEIIDGNLHYTADCKHAHSGEIIPIPEWK